VSGAQSHTRIKSKACVRCAATMSLGNELSYYVSAHPYTRIPPLSYNVAATAQPRTLTHAFLPARSYNAEKLAECEGARLLMRMRI
jgi:hypothetical protein